MESLFHTSLWHTHLDGHEQFIGRSFPTIAAEGPNGANPHYFAAPETCRTVWVLMRLKFEVWIDISLSANVVILRIHFIVLFMFTHFIPRSFSDSSFFLFHFYPSFQLQCSILRIFSSFTLWLCANAGGPWLDALARLRRPIFRRDHRRDAHFAFGRTFSVPKRVLYPGAAGKPQLGLVRVSRGDAGLCAGCLSETGTVWIIIIIRRRRKAVHM